MPSDFDCRGCDAIQVSWVGWVGFQARFGFVLRLLDVFGFIVDCPLVTTATTTSVTIVTAATSAFQATYWTNSLMQKRRSWQS